MWKLCKTVLHLPWKFQDQKPRPLETPHNFFLVIPENSTCYFLVWYPWKFHILNPTPPVWIFSGRGCVFFFIWFCLVFHPSWFFLLRIGCWWWRWWGKRGGTKRTKSLLNGQNLLSLTKVICRQSLNYLFV